MITGIVGYRVGFLGVDCSEFVGSEVLVSEGVFVFGVLLKVRLFFSKVFMFFFWGF